MLKQTRKNSKNHQLILASSSPRRIQMMRDLGLKFKVMKPDIPEIHKRGESAKNFVSRLSKEKALVALEQLSAVSLSVSILAADTVVVFGSGSQEKILGKPKNEKDALRMLMALSGKTHSVLTGFCWLDCDPSGRIKFLQKVIKSDVKFAKRSRTFWKWYVSTGEPLDKAGSYAAQGVGMSFIESVKGSYSNVIGLPLPQVLSAYEVTFGTKLIGNS